MIDTALISEHSIVQEVTHEALDRPAARDEPTTSPARTPISWAGAKPAIGAVLAVTETTAAKSSTTSSVGERAGVGRAGRAGRHAQRSVER